MGLYLEMAKTVFVTCNMSMKYIPRAGKLGSAETKKLQVFFKWSRNYPTRSKLDLGRFTILLWILISRHITSYKGSFSHITSRVIAWEYIFVPSIEWWHFHTRETCSDHGFLGHNGVLPQYFEPVPEQYCRSNQMVPRSDHPEARPISERCSSHGQEQQRDLG